MPPDAQKYRIVRDTLLQEIRSGFYQPGERLPAERELASRFGVSHMTARRAVGELVEDNLLERRAPLGTFVRDKSVATRNINIICPSHSHPLTLQFVTVCMQQIEAQGALGKPVYFGSHDDYAARRALRGGDPNIVLLDSLSVEGPLARDVVEARDRSVLIGNRFDAEGVHSVMTDETTATRLALEYLQRHGHRSIALICDDPETYIESVRIAQWQEAMRGVLSPLQMQEFLVATRTPRHGDVGQQTYYAITKFLQKHGTQVTALLTAGILQVVATLAACRDSNFWIPETLSLVNGVDNSILKFTYPAVTCVDNALDKQVAKALEILNCLQPSSPSGRRKKLQHFFHQVEPQLIERASVSTLDSTLISSPKAMRKIATNNSFDKRARATNVLETVS